MPRGWGRGRPRGKFNNVKTNGYHSKKEARRAEALKVLETAGEISELREQVKVELIPKQDGERACHWIADFVYIDNNTGEEIWEDCKGFRTDVYKIKRKLFQYRYGKKILET